MLRWANLSSHSRLLLGCFRPSSGNHHNSLLHGPATITLQVAMVWHFLMPCLHKKLSRNQQRCTVRRSLGQGGERFSASSDSISAHCDENGVASRLHVQIGPSAAPIWRECLRHPCGHTVSSEAGWSNNKGRVRSLSPTWASRTCGNNLAFR